MISRRVLEMRPTKGSVAFHLAWVPRHRSRGDDRDRGHDGFESLHELAR